MRAGGLPRYALGTGGLPVAEGPSGGDTAAEVIALAIECGLNWIDTASLYQRGRAEGAVGRALRGRPRDSFLLSTKTGYVMNEATVAAMVIPDPRVVRYPPQDFGYDATMRSLERSFERLGVEHVDIVFLHAPTAAHLGEIESGAMPALEELVKAGKIGAIGAGMVDVSDATAVTTAFPLDYLMIAGHYTLLVRDAAEELFACCAARGTGVIAAAVFNSGLLADPHQALPRFNYAPADAAMIERAGQLEDVCRSFATPLRAAAVQFPLRHPFVASTVIGPRSVHELRDTLAMIGYPVPAALWETLDRVTSPLV